MFVESKDNPSFLFFCSFFIVFLFSFKIYLFYIWVVYLHICILGAYRVQMWALDPLELEFWMVMRHYADASNENQVLCKSCECS